MITDGKHRTRSYGKSFILLDVYKLTVSFTNVQEALSCKERSIKWSQANRYLGPKNELLFHCMQFSPTNEKTAKLSDNCNVIAIYAVFPLLVDIWR